MTEYKEKIFNIETGETIWRDYTKAEIQEVEAELTQIAKEQADIEAKRAAQAAEKASVLNRLGLTEEELKTLLG